MRIDGGRLSLAALRRVAAGAETVELDPRAEAAMTASVEAVRAIVAQGNPAYGINTGFGKLAKTQIPASDLATLQRNLVLSHCVGLGPPLDERTTRLVLALKAASLACGLSGVRPRIVAALIKFLTEDLLPVIPAKGSVGASGDLAPLAHMTAALMGIGSVRHKGRTLRATDALRRAGLDPLVLEAKEGLALINGTQVSTALALSGLFAIEDCFAAALGAGALSVDAARGSDAPFDPRIHAARGHAGQGEVAARLRGLLAGSGIRASHLVNDERVQDPYSLRCQPQVMGACLDLLHQAAATIATEAASVTDNPLVFAETGEVLSGGNFHAEPVAFASDILALAAAEIGALSERRIALLIDAGLSGLPAFLVRDAGLNSGFMIAHVTAAALTSENKALAHPRSVDSLPTSANQEDHVSMAAAAGLRLGEMAANLRGIVAVELLAAAQGIDFLATLKTSPALADLHKRIRMVVPFYDKDRLIAPDIEAIADLIAAGVFRDTAEDLLPSGDGGR